jgi:hypothetical protein
MGVTKSIKWQQLPRYALHERLPSYGFNCRIELFCLTIIGQSTSWTRFTALFSLILVIHWPRASEFTAKLCFQPVKEFSFLGPKLGQNDRLPAALCFIFQHSVRLCFQRICKKQGFCPFLGQNPAKLCFTFLPSYPFSHNGLPRGCLWLYLPSSLFVNWVTGLLPGLPMAY